MPSRVTTQVVAPDMFIGEVSGFMLSSQGKNSSTTDSFDYDEERSNHQGSTNTSLLLSGLFAVFMMMSYPTSKIPSHVAEDDANLHIVLHCPALYCPLLQSSIALHCNS